MKKRKLEEAEAEENQSAPKRRNQPVKQPADEGFTADSEEEVEEEEEDLKEKKKNKTKSRPEDIKGEWNQTREITIKKLTLQHSSSVETRARERWLIT